MSNGTSQEMKFLATMIRHRDNIQTALSRIVNEIEERGLRHDLSKFKEDEAEGFVRINKTARNCEYGSEEYENTMVKEKGEDGCITKHFSRNRHHVEFHDSAHDMTFIDIIEMVCDWWAASKTYGTNTLQKKLPELKEQGDFSEPQLWLIDEVVEMLNDD